MTRRVLVTGARGCIGRHVVPILVSHGWDVHGVTSGEPPAPASGVTWHRTDLLRPGAADELVRRTAPSHLVHLAWYIAPGRWAEAPQNFEWVEASLALVRAFRTSGGQRVVTAGSCLEYDWRYGYCSEALTPRTPHTVYGVCKHALEQLTTALARDGAMSSAWGRVFFLYGPHEHPDRLVASVVRSLLAGQPARCSHGRQVRDYLYVEDVADALVKLLESDVSGPINIASGRATTLREIVSRAGELVGRPELIQFGAIPQAATDTPLVVADTSRLTAELAWSPRFDLDEGLARTIAWWRQEALAGAAR